MAAKRGKTVEELFSLIAAENTIMADAKKTVEGQAGPQRRSAPASRTAPPCAAWACASSTARATLEDTPAVRGMINKVSLPGQGALSADGHMQLNTIKPADGSQARQAPRRSRHRLGPGQDRRSRPQGPEVACGRLPQGRLRRRPDAAAAPPAQARLQVGTCCSSTPKSRSPISRQLGADRSRPADAQAGRPGRPAGQDRQGHQVRRADKKVVKLKGIGATAGAKAAIEARLAGIAWSTEAQTATKDKHSVATNANQLAKSGKFGDLRRRLVFLLLALVVYRVGAHIPVPGIDPNQLQQLFQGQQGGILSLFNMFSGGALSRFTVFALGIMPYISASIIMQLMTYVVPDARGS